MDAITRYGKYYFTVIVCFTLAAMLAAGISGEVIPVSGEGRGNIIILDPGHGGEDGGAVSVTGAKESEINLEISLRLREVLRLCGLRTDMTRDGDYSIYDSDCGTIARKKASDLRNRVKLLNAQPDAILLSIHQNHYPDEKYYGAQVFYNAEENSKILADTMQEALRGGLDAENLRKTKSVSGVFLMEKIQNTAVLIECGFLSNRREEAMLRTEEYQKKVSCSICAGLLRFLNEQNVI